jgi:hypothetical protein
VTEQGTKKLIKLLYPADLADYVLRNWQSELKQNLPPGQIQNDPREAPALNVLQTLLSISYQASLMTHEGEPVVFRVTLADPESFADGAGPPDGLQKLQFTEHVPLSPDELRRLSPAVRFSRSMIGVRLNADGELEVWGVIHTGPRWLHANHGGRGSAPAMPSSLVVKVMGPGTLEVANGDFTVASLADGKLYGQALNVFSSDWLREWFAPIRKERMELHQKAKLQSRENWADLDPDLTRVINQHMIKRIIAAMRAFRHGGTLILVPPERASALMGSNRYLTMKYKFAESQSRGRFRTLILDVMNTLARLHVEGSRPIGWRDYQQTNDPRIMALDESIFEMSHLISTLSVSDGAVVLTKRFELLGFGAEIHCESSENTMLAQAVDLEGKLFKKKTVHGVGTRHRSAYRLCQQMKDALVIVVSQEGAVQFARWKDEQVMFWEHQGSFDFSAVN